MASEQISRTPRAPGKAFDFGRNWQEYSLRFLDEARLAEAARSLAQLLGAEALRGRSFLDVGCGTGMFSLAAARLGAQPVVGLDVDGRCIAVSQRNAARFRSPGAAPRFVRGSILDGPALAALGQFDLVYAWGSLHHTGAMWRAIRRAAERVAPGGRLALAIYHRHVTSPAWRLVKRLYNALPSSGRALMAGFFAAAIYLAKLLATRRNPLRKRRGMSFLVDVVDWIGGYPYEYASPREVREFVEGLGLELERAVPAPVPTGCNEFVFRKPAVGIWSQAPRGA